MKAPNSVVSFFSYPFVPVLGSHCLGPGLVSTKIYSLQKGIEMNDLLTL